MTSSRRSSTRSRWQTSPALAVGAAAALAVAAGLGWRARGSRADRSQQAMATRRGPDADRALVDVVRSEVMTKRPYRESAVNVVATDGTVILRGQLEPAELIARIRGDVAEVPGVRRVESYLHPPGTEPPTRADVLEAP